jgi:hypothetical protein
MQFAGNLVFDRGNPRLRAKEVRKKRRQLVRLLKNSFEAHTGLLGNLVPISKNSNVGSVINELLNPEINPRTIVKNLRQLVGSLRRGSAKPEFDALADFYRAFAPLRVDRRAVDTATRFSRTYRSDKTVPHCNSATAFELIMAAMDGRRAHFMKDTSPVGSASSPAGTPDFQGGGRELESKRYVPRPALQLGTMLEQGFSTQADLTDYLYEEISNAIAKLPAEYAAVAAQDASSPEDRLRLLEDDLELMTVTLFLDVDDRGKSALLQADIELIQRFLPALMLVAIGGAATDTSLSVSEENSLTNPFRGRLFDPPSETDPA